jgi:Domain of unknown function (DUF4177)
MQPWEYKVLSRTARHGFGDGGERELNALGKDGWELVSVTMSLAPGNAGRLPNETDILYFLKRPT